MNNFHDYHSTWDLVDRLIKASCQQHANESDMGWAAAVGLLNVYLVEAINDLSWSQRQEWKKKLKRTTQDIEQKTIIQRLRQEETYE